MTGISSYSTTSWHCWCRRRDLQAVLHTWCLCWKVTGRLIHCDLLTLTYLLFLHCR